jgi:hypothetical protein
MKYDETYMDKNLIGKLCSGICQMQGLSSFSESWCYEIVKVFPVNRDGLTFEWLFGPRQAKRSEDYVHRNFHLLVLMPMLKRL